MLSIVVAAAPLAACSSSGTGPMAATADTGARPTTDAATLPDADPAPALDSKGCVVPDDGVPPGAVCLRSLRAKVVDEAGAPIANLFTSACGDGCTYATTDAAGVTAIELHRYMRRPALLLHGHVTYASYYVLVSGDGDVDLGTLRLSRLPAVGTPFPVDGKGGSIAAGDVTLTLPSGATIDVDTIEFDQPDQQQLRVLPVSAVAPPAFVDPSLKIAALYALGPFGTTISPGAAVSVKNTAKLPPGAAVEFFVQGTDLTGKYGRFGGFGKLADGHVSADGTTIGTDPTQSIGDLSWIGVRLKGS